MTARRQRAAQTKIIRKFRLIRTHRGWWQRFWDPQSLLGLKLLLLATSFLLASLIGP